MEKQELYDMCKSIIDLNKQIYVIIKNQIEDIIRNNIRYFKIEELKELDNEGFEWLDNLKKLYKICNIMLQNLKNKEKQKIKLN